MTSPQTDYAVTIRAELEEMPHAERLLAAIGLAGLVDEIVREEACRLAQLESWRVVGNTVGTSAQAAWQRWSGPNALALEDSR